MSAQRRFLGYLPPVNNHQIDFSHDERGPKVSPLIPIHGGRTFPTQGEGCKGLLSACRIGGAAKREEVVPTNSQFLQAQGHITSFVLKYKDPGHRTTGWLCKGFPLRGMAGRTRQWTAKLMRGKIFSISSTFVSQQFTSSPSSRVYSPRRSTMRLAFPVKRSMVLGSTKLTVISMPNTDLIRS